MTTASCPHLVVGPSPLIVTALGWYDGLTDGFALCKSCGRSFHFALTAWDDERRLRVYGFAQVTDSAYRRVVEVDGDTTYSAEARADLLALAARDALASASTRDVYVIAEDIGERLLAVRSFSFVDWARLLGSGRSRSPLDV